MVILKRILTSTLLLCIIFLISCTSTETMDLPSEDQMKVPPTGDDLVKPTPGTPPDKQGELNNQGIVSGNQDEFNTQDSVPSRSTDFVFTVHNEFLIDYASNPMIIDYQDGLLTLAYQSKASALLHKPNEQGKVAFSSDGYTFEDRGVGPSTDELRSADGIQLNDGTYIRYYFNQADSKLYAETSSDGITYERIEDAAYDFNNDLDKGYFGVRTFYVDNDGGVVMMYSGPNEGQGGKGLIYLRQAYSNPEDNGLSFTLINEDVAGEVNEYGHGLSYFDPHITALPDGRFLLVTIFQEHFVNGHSPPLNRDGHIVGFVSDGGTDFEMVGTLFSYTDFTFDTVHSLNDPKVIVYDDGSIGIYVAAMLEDTEREDCEQNICLRWVLVNARTDVLFN